MRLIGHSFYAPHEDVLGHTVIFYNRTYTVVREEVQYNTRMVFMVTEHYEDGMVKGMWTERHHIADPHQTVIYWHPDKTRVAPRAVCDDLYARAKDAERVRARQATLCQERMEEDRLLFEQFLREKAPEGTKAILVAELRRDDSDVMRDYFSSSVVRCVFLGFSKSSRNSFPEMRKLAAGYEPTAHLSGPEGVEYRENYVGGHGYFLGGRWCNSGWQVVKYVLPHRPNMRVDCWPWLTRQGKA